MLASNTLSLCWRLLEFCTMNCLWLLKWKYGGSSTYGWRWRIPHTYVLDPRIMAITCMVPRVRAFRRVRFGKCLHVGISSGKVRNCLHVYIHLWILCWAGPEYATITSWLIRWVGPDWTKRASRDDGPESADVDGHLGGLVPGCATEHNIPWRRSRNGSCAYAYRCKIPSV